MKYVVLSPDAQAVTMVFASPQSPDMPGYAEIDDTDSRYLAFVAQRPLIPPSPPQC
jgi:hypothetical protein